MPLIEEIMYEPEVILVDLPRETSERIQQQKICVDSTEHKQNACIALIKRHESEKILIFINKKQTSETLVPFLQSRGIAVAVLHGDIEQNIRNEQLRKFRNNDVNVIIATDVASRGLDIEGLDLVINYDIPKNANDYIHRVGRTGRMNQSGTAVNLVSQQTWNKMISIENFIGQKCELVSLAEFPSKFTGPAQVRKSGKTWGKKTRKQTKAKNVKERKKNRLRDRKNIGKRRLPSTKE
jgi:superfamily II DNA/RNA helicase